MHKGRGAGTLEGARRDGSERHVAVSTGLQQRLGEFEARGGAFVDQVVDAVGGVSISLTMLCQVDDQVGLPTSSVTTLERTALAGEHFIGQFRMRCGKLRPSTAYSHAVRTI